MNQTIKGMILGTVMTVASLLLISSVSHAEWFNSRAPLSDSSTLKRVAEALEKKDFPSAEAIWKRAKVMNQELHKEQAR